MEEKIKMLEELRAALQAETSAAKKAAVQAQISALEAEIASAAAAATSTSHKLPGKGDVVGILLSIEEVSSSKGDVIILSIQDANDDITAVAVSPAYWAKIGRLFREEDTVKASYEKRVQGITEYQGEDGTWKKHTSSGLNLLTLSRFSAKSFERSVAQRQREEDLVVLQTAEIERVSAIAEYLKATLR